MMSDIYPETSPSKPRAKVANESVSAINQTSNKPPSQKAGQPPRSDDAASSQKTTVADSQKTASQAKNWSG